MPQFLKYFPLIKVDESAHTITGLSTAEKPDKDGEICDYEYAKTRSYPDWSNEAFESTKAAGQELSYGNIRVQHTLEIGGKVKTPVIFDDVEKAVHLETEPENDAIWTKAKKGFLRGMSQGGDYAWRKCNDCETDIPQGRHCPKCKKTVFVRYGATISEVSYVDNPALKVATFSLVKSDGSTEINIFNEGSSEMEVKEELVSKPPMGGDGVPSVPPTVTAIDVEALTAQVTKSVMEQIGKAVKYLVTDKDGKGHLPYTKADGEPDHRLMGAAFAALHGGYRGNKYEGEGKEKAIARLKSVYRSEGMETPSEKAAKAVSAVIEKASKDRGLEKSLYDVAQFASIMQDLCYLHMSSQCEAAYEEDQSPVPEELGRCLESLALAFVAMAEEEVNELTAAAVTKGAITTMSNENALAKAQKSLVEQLSGMKKSVEDFGKAMSGSIDGIHKTVSGDFNVQGSGPDPIDPQAQGTPGSMKAADAPVQKTADPVVEPKVAEAKAVEPTYTKAEVDDLLKKTIDQTVTEMVKAMMSDDDAPQVAKAAAGIGNRSQMPLSGGGPAIRVMPEQTYGVTKAQDNLAASQVAEPAPTAEDIQRALSGDAVAAAKFMKGVQSTDQIPTALAGSLRNIRR